ncbi:MAG: phosphoribosylpyrophosphate synthetase [Ferruginibacter sp.]
METYDTVTAALSGLNARGYTTDFNIAFDKLICNKKETTLDLHEFEIVEVYRFEGDSNPDDEDVVYAVESFDKNIKGTLTSAYGMYADNISTEMLRKLSMHK